MRKLFVLRRSALLVSALLASAVLQVARAAEPDVLSKVPGDAYGMLVVNNVRNLATRISNAATRLNIPAPPDLVGYATRNLGITEGFNPDSSAAIVFLKPAADHQGESYFNGQPPAVIILPTTDAKAMLKPFEPKEPDKAGISEVKLPQDPADKGYVVTIDEKWVAFAQSKEDLTAYMARTSSFADKAGPATKKVFETNDLVIWGDVPKLSTGLDKAIDDAQTNFSGMLDLANMANNQDAVAGAMQKHMVGVFFNFARQFLKDANSSMLTLRMSESGASVGAVGDFKSDSPIGSFVGALKDVKPVTLQGLPNGNGGFLTAGAATWDAASMVKIFSSVGDSVLSDETVAKDPRAADFKREFETLKKIMSITNGATFVALDPPAGGKTGYFCGAVLINTTNPEEFKKLQADSIKNMSLQQSMNPDIVQKFTMTSDAVTIKDVKLSKINIKFSLREETPDKPLNPGVRMVFPMMQKVYGPDGITAYMGTVGTRVLVIYGSDPATLESAVTAAQENTEELANNPTISQVKDQVVANPIAVAYLPITRWITLAQSIIKPGSESDPMSPGIANAPPVVVSAGITGSMMTMELHVPIATVTGAQEAVQRLQRSMMGGGGPTPQQLP